MNNITGGAKGVKQLPGTTIEVGRITDGDSRQIFDNIFSCGGLVLSQVCNMTGLEAHTVQNWVKRRYVTSPKGRMYDVDQFSRLVIINMLKQSLSLDSIESLLSYINGHLDDNRDDMITDSELYHLFVCILIRLDGGVDIKDVEKAAEAVTENYNEPCPGAKRRLCKVLGVMAYSYYSSELRKKAELMMRELD